MPRASRLQTSAQFTAVVRRGCQSSDSNFAVYAMPNGTPYARLGVTVSRRVARSAVRRNWIKRQIREGFRHDPERLTGLDVVVIARGRAASNTGPVLRAALSQHYRTVAERCRRS